MDSLSAGQRYRPSLHPGEHHDPCHEQQGAIFRDGSHLLRAQQLGEHVRTHFGNAKSKVRSEQARPIRDLDRYLEEVASSGKDTDMLQKADACVA